MAAWGLFVKRPYKVFKQFNKSKQEYLLFEEFIKWILTSSSQNECDDLDNE